MLRDMKPIGRSSPWPFFILTYVWSGIFGVLAVLIDLPHDATPAMVLRVLHGLGPMIAAVTLTYRTQDEDGRREYWRRVIDIKRIRSRWWAVVLLTVPLVTGLAALIDLFLGGHAGAIELRFQSNPLSLLPFAAFTLFFGPLPEELGWRGFALERLQERFSALVSSLFLGMGWGLWHLPLFFIQGTYQHGLGLATTAFWLFMLTILFQSIMMTWIFNNSSRSTLAAILFHFMVNYVGELLILTPQAEVYRVVVWAMLSLAVIIIWGPKHLRRVGNASTSR